VRLVVLIFASRDTPDVYDRAETLYAALAACTTPAIQARFLDKLSRSVEELRLFVRHRVVQTPTVLVLRGQEEVARVLEVPPPEDFLGVLQTLT
jgi:hypothetical protein